MRIIRERGRMCFKRTRSIPHSSSAGENLSSERKPSRISSCAASRHKSSFRSPPGFDLRRFCLPFVWCFFLRLRVFWNPRCPFVHGTVEQSKRTCLPSVEGGHVSANGPYFRVARQDKKGQTTRATG